MQPPESQPAGPRRPWLLWASLAAVSVVVVVAIATSEMSGTGAENVGDLEPAKPSATAPAPAVRDRAGRRDSDGPRNCKATRSNPGGTNNFIPDAPRADSLGEGFVITGTVRAAAGCRPLEGVPVQVWLATETGGEQDNRATVLTGEDGRFRIETAPTIPQFGEPNVHVAHDGDRYRKVFIRRVVDLDDTRATVDLTLARDG